MRISDWSSDVCSSDLAHPEAAGPEFHQQSLKGWEHTMSVSLRSVFLSMKHEIAHMIDHGGGAIANVTSLAAMLYVGVSGAAYEASKAGVIRPTTFDAVTYADRGVRVNCIAPAVTPTEASNHAGSVIVTMEIERSEERRVGKGEVRRC